MSVSRETQARLSALCERYGLSECQRARAQALLTALATDARAPTTVRDPAGALDVHLADSLTALELGWVRAAERIADLGAGAGFPGLALALALARSEVGLIESHARKCAFLEELIGSAGIENARVVCTRAEEWREGLGSRDLVVARALARQPVVLEYAAPLLRLGGSLVDWRGKRDAADERAAALAAQELGLSLVEIRRVEPYAGARDHHLHVYEKVSPTPARYPRRAGIARKRPLGC